MHYLLLVWILYNLSYLHERIRLGNDHLLLVVVLLKGSSFILSVHVLFLILILLLVLVELWR